MGAAGSGAQNSYAFSAAVDSGSLPDVESITYQGIFNEHWYGVGEPDPEYPISVVPFGLSRAVPNTDEKERWLALFLMSSQDGKPRDKHDKPINMSVVIDTSGSMNLQSTDTHRLQLAKDGVRMLLEDSNCLRDTDFIAISTFSITGHKLHPLTQVGKIQSRADYLAAVDKLSARGGTVLEAGVAIGREQLRGADPTHHQRILFLTDMGEMNADTLDKMIRENAKDNIFISIMAIGADFNSILTETLMKNRGSNYMCVTKKSEMQEEMADKFAHNFFPVCHGLKINLRSGDLRVKRVFGTSYDAVYVGTKSGARRAWRGWTPHTHGTYASHWRQVASRLMLSSYSTRNAQASLTGFLIGRILDFLDNSHTVCEVNTMFPSDLAEGGAMQGGLVLVQLEPSPGAKPSDDLDVQACVTYMDAQDQHWTSEAGVQGPPPLFGSATAGLAAAAEKGLVLHDYVRSCRGTLSAYHARFGGSTWNKQPTKTAGQNAKDEPGVDLEGLETKRQWVTAQVARLASLGGAAARRIDKVVTDYDSFVDNVKNRVTASTPAPTTTPASTTTPAPTITPASLAPLTPKSFRACVEQSV